MEGTSRRILRNEDVILKGQYYLGVGQSEVGRDKPQRKNTVSASARASILENHPEYVVLEVICTCGEKICLRCEYGNAKTPNNEQRQSNAAKVESDQMN